MLIASNYIDYETKRKNILKKISKRRRERASTLKKIQEENDKKVILEKIRRKDIQIERRKQIIYLLIGYGVKVAKKRAWFSVCYTIKVLDRVKEMLEVSNSLKD